MAEKVEYFDIEVECTLRKTVCNIVVPLDEIDEFGDIDTSSVNWYGKYSRQHHDLQYLLSRLCDYIKNDIEMAHSDAERAWLLRMLKDAEGWEINGCYAELIQ